MKEKPEAKSKDKPQKPYPDFPLFAHNNGQWAKKIRGKLHYFGQWGDWRSALKSYHLLVDGPKETLESVIERYLESQRLSDETGHRHLTDLQWTLGRFKKIVGPKKMVASLKSVDYERWRAELTRTNGPVSVGNHVRKIRSFLGWCVDEKIINQLPVTKALKKPSRAQLRLERAKRGSKMFEPAEIKKLLKFAAPQMKAMILLGINAGLGPTDLANLKIEHLVDGWLMYPRPKTGVERRIPLWKETQEALSAVIRPNDELVFRTETGRPWLNEFETGVDSPITTKFRQLSKDLGVHKKGRGIYGLRHTVQTIGEESGDSIATSAILGHVPDADDMSAVYRERVSDFRLQKVVTFIHAWLFGKPATQPRLNLPPIVVAPVEVSS